MDSETQADTAASPDAPPVLERAEEEIQKVLKGIESEIDDVESDKNELQEQIEKLEGDYRVIEEIGREIAKWQTGTAAEMRHAREHAEIEAQSWRAEAGHLETKLSEMESLAIKRGAFCTDFRKKIARLERDVLQARRDLRLEEGDRQMVVLALAELSMRRPGWQDATARIAATLYGSEMFAGFRETSADQIEPIPLPEKDREPMVECPACEAWSTWAGPGGPGGNAPCPLCGGARKVLADSIRKEP